MGDRATACTVHGTCIAIAEAGVLIRGASGAGKSDLALRMIDEGARLVADDQVRLRLGEGHLIASAPDTIKGLLEVSGVGLARLGPQHIVESAVLRLVVDLAPVAEIDRLPAPRTETLLGTRIPLLGLDPFETSAAAKLRLAAGRGPGAIMRVP
ncbi:MAG: HPr kinase/phosphatase C-terminal domain-containing protein [Alphaproteobacteria bacterium]|nr:HPr kinase/phosphatase C-terminal domain-containing protein [Alphaproteobacteria bacterium]